MLKGRVEWNRAFDEVIELAGKKDFNPDNIRGRGAWRESGGKICFNTGNKILGEYNPVRLYLKKNPVDMGFGHAPIDKELALDMRDVIMNLSFETRLDAMRCMAWSVLAPFSGALPWRPAILMTGSSGSGKTTVSDYIIKKISNSFIFNGAETTPAFLRQYMQNDSFGVILEEAETDTLKKKQNREALLSVMRQSTSDEAPISGKGSASGRAISYNMKNMFLFIAISPEIESAADNNRIFRVNMVKPRNDWFEIRKQINSLITEDNCKAIRSLTWKRLRDILIFAKQLTPVVQDIIKKDTRRCYAESLLFSAYLIVWYGFDKLDLDQARFIIEEYLKDELIEIIKDDAEELLERLLDETVFLSESKKNITIREMLNQIYSNPYLSNSEEYKETLGRHGLAIYENNYLAMISNHHEIKKIIERGKGYNRIFWRHPGCVERYKNVRILGKSRQCVIIEDVLEKVDIIPGKTEDTRETEINQDLIQEK